LGSNCGIPCWSRKTLYVGGDAAMARRLLLEPIKGGVSPYINETLFELSILRRGMI
jgi:hypothetical protein